MQMSLDYIHVMIKKTPRRSSQYNELKIVNFKLTELVLLIHKSFLKY